MKIKCNVIKDILPLYIENIASEDTRVLIEEHIDECEDCKKKYPINPTRELMNLLTSSKDDFKL